MASWETKPESWEETLERRVVAGCARLHMLDFRELELLGDEGGVWYDQL